MMDAKQPLEGQIAEGPHGDAVSSIASQATRKPSNPPVDHFLLSLSLWIGYVLDTQKAVLPL